MMKNEQHFADVLPVKVALRIRPLSDQDRKQTRFAKVNDDDCLITTQDTVRVVPRSKLFTFDHVFGPTTPQYEIFSTLGKDLVSKFIEGNNITVLAFGQASSGKTFTMGTAQRTGKFDKRMEGIIPRTMMELFEVLQQQSYNNAPLFTTSSPTTSMVTPSPSKPNSAKSWLSNIPTPSKSTGTPIHQPSILTHKVKISYIEVCNEELNDLLNDAPITERPPITIREDTKGQIYWTGVKQVNVSNVDDVLLYLKKGAKSRSTDPTGINEKSSRSHAIFSVTLQQEKWVPSSSSTLSWHQHQLSSHLKLEQSSHGQSYFGGDWVTMASKFHFVDLAGGVCSRQKDIEGNRQNEEGDIDSGLQAFENVISALGDISKRGSHVPYLDSKLTTLLQDSLGGNTATLMIGCASPLKQDLSETLNTLQYALHARNIKNLTKRNSAEIWKISDNLDTSTDQLKPLLVSTSGTPKRVLSPSTTSSKPRSDKITTIGFPKCPQDWEEQQCIITDLQQQIKKLNGEATALEERNKSIETELQHFKYLYQQCSRNRQHHPTFEYLVEPVVELYEHCVTGLELENSVLKAAVNHSNMGMDELQIKCDDLQRTVNQQQDTMAGLYGRLTTMVERHHSISTCIDELETGLKQAADKSTRDQEALGELRKKTVKWHEETGKLGLYFRNLEQKVAGAKENHIQLCVALDLLEHQRLEQNKMNANLQQQMTMKWEKEWSQRQSTLRELDDLNEKCRQLEMDRDKWKIQAEHHYDLYSTHLDPPAKPTTDNKNVSLQFISNDYKFRSYQTNHNTKADQPRIDAVGPSDNKRTGASWTALNTIKADHQPSCSPILKLQVEQLGNKHSHTINELDGVLQRYYEMLDYAEHLEHISVMETTQPSTTSYSVTNCISSRLSVFCNPDTPTSTISTGTIPSTVDDRISELPVLSSSTDF